MLKFYYGTAAQYASATKDSEALYFITDQKKIYKGSVDYTEAARVVASMPASPAQGIVYFDQSDSKVKVFDGTNTNVIALPASALIGSGSTDNTVATSKAVYDAITPLAPKASPVFTGTPEAPTASRGTNTTQIATTAFVKDACDQVQAALAGALHFKGVVNTVADLPASGNVEGDVYQVKTNPQGTDAEYVWTLNGTTSAGAWEELGAVIDLSAYATKAECDTYYDAIGAAAAVLGSSGDAASAATVYGAKARLQLFTVLRLTLIALLLTMTLLALLLQLLQVLLVHLVMLLRLIPFTVQRLTLIALLLTMTLPALLLQLRVMLSVHLVILLRLTRFTAQRHMLIALLLLLLHGMPFHNSYKITLNNLWHTRYA